MATLTDYSDMRPLWKWRWLRLLNAIARLKGKKISGRRRRGERSGAALGLFLAVVAIVIYLVGWTAGFGRAERRYDL